MKRQSAQKFSTKNVFYFYKVENYTFKRIQENGTEMNLFAKQKTETQMQRTNVWTPKGERRGGMNWEIGIDVYTMSIVCVCVCVCVMCA